MHFESDQGGPGQIYFQQVASGYLLHFVQDGSSKNVLENYFLHKHIKHPNIRKIRIYSPLTPDQPPFKGGLYVNDDDDGRGIWEVLLPRQVTTNEQASIRRTS